MINTLTLNPAIDKILFIDKFEKTVTARIKRQDIALGGKGVHISINLKIMGMDSTAFGILFGDVGHTIEDTLADMGVASAFVWGEGEGRESRTNYVLIEDDRTSTIVADKGVTLSEGEVRAIIDKLKERVRRGDILVFSGDASNVPDPYIYNRVMEELSGKDARVYIDASGETLRKAVESSPFLIKPNRDELETITGERIVTQGDVIKGIADLKKYRIENIAVSLGSEGSVVLLGDSLWSAAPPDIRAENTVGCGDCFLSGLIFGITNGWDAEKIVRYATAVSAATASSPMSVGYDTDYAAGLMDKVVVKKL
ncbi:MAG: 1-phosphofructokinase family hexose kinase [Clostridiales Family XIII bacterium]|jgi:1-phosphofructokinase family hexose kinase|nr:1-phosphofructokinase family hexose kinase [Clostridiales Family XIII bacterium]